VGRRSGCQASAAEADVEGAACLGPRDTPTQQAGSVFAGEGNQLSGGVENRDGHRGEVAAASVSQRLVHDGARGPEADPVCLTDRHLIHLQTESSLSV
jgi:hypothetical protein